MSYYYDENGNLKNFYELPEKQKIEISCKIGSALYMQYGISYVAYKEYNFNIREIFDLVNNLFPYVISNCFLTTKEIEIFINSLEALNKE